MDLKMWKKILHRTGVCIKLLEIPIISYAVTLMYLICYLLETESEREYKKIMLDLLSVNANLSDIKRRSTQWNRNADETHLIPDKMN